MKTTKNNTLWTKNFTTIIIATTFGAVGNIAGSFAMSFLVYEETKSTLAAAVTIALKVIPGFIIPLVISPIMDRLPRKPFLVFCDAAASVVYIIAGLWLREHDFQYIYYLLFSLVIASLGSFDELSYNSVYPKLIPEGMEEKGYSVTSMLYPLLTSVMMPLSAVLYKKIGVANILIAQGGLCLLASVTESRIKIKEEVREGTRFSVKQWWGDIKESAAYLKNERGILNLSVYSSINNGMSMGYESIMVAFFSSMPGFTISMYSFFTVVEMIGRTVGGVLMYKKPIKSEKKYAHAMFVHFFYDIMDTVLLWLPYPLMLINRTVCGFLGIQSATMRYAAVQKYIPESMRARVNAFNSMLFLVISAVLSLFVGWLGEKVDLRAVLTITGSMCIIACLLTLVRRKEAVKVVYSAEGRNEN